MSNDKAEDRLIYAGIGSRETPPDVLTLMEDFALEFSDMALLRSGGCKGADLAFEYGVHLMFQHLNRYDVTSFAEIYWPWPGYGRETGHLRPKLTKPTEEAFRVSALYHPAWEHLSPGVKKLHARNAHIILGEDLNTPVDFVVCWTPDGSRNGTGPKSGGTGQALRIAAALDIQVLNMYNFKDWVRIQEMAEDNELAEDSADN